MGSRAVSWAKREFLIVLTRVLYSSLLLFRCRHIHYMYVPCVSRTTLFILAYVDCTTNPPTFTSGYILMCMYEPSLAEL